MTTSKALRDATTAVNREFDEQAAKRIDVAGLQKKREQLLNELAAVDAALNEREGKSE